MFHTTTLQGRAKAPAMAEESSSKLLGRGYYTTPWQYDTLYKPIRPMIECPAQRYPTAGQTRLGKSNFNFPRARLAHLVDASTEAKKMKILSVIQLSQPP